MKTFLIAGAMALTLAAAPAAAADLKILVGGSMNGPMKDLAPKFEQASGHKLVMEFAGTPDLIKQATSAPFDAGFVPIEVMKNADARAKFNEPVNIARVGYGVAVKTGAPKPDISTPDKFKDAMLKAQSYTVYPESAVGAFVLKTLEKVGIADEMKSKLKPATNPAGVVSAVANGDAQYGLFLTSVLTAPGLEAPVPFPAELNSDLIFVGAAAASTPNAAAAQAFVDFLKSPEAVAILRAKGVTPG